MTTVITGATGMIGNALLPHLSDRVVLTRRPDRYQGPSARAFPWNALEGPPPPASLEGADTIIHLAGSPIAEGRWNEEKKQRIRDSRVLGTRHLIDGMLAQGPVSSGSGAERPLFLCASATGYYGDRGDEVLKEETKPGTDFLAQVCAEWEAETRRASEAGWRVVNVRTGIVLGRDGGALPRMKTPFRFGLGARLGSGKQWMSWIHEFDMTALLRHCIETDLEGPVNAVSPNPVTNRDFTAQLGQAVHRPAPFVAPGWLLRVLVGEFATFLLGSQRVLPTHLLKRGFSFRHPELGSALTDLL